MPFFPTPAPPPTSPIASPITQNHDLRGVTAPPPLTYLSRPLGPAPQCPFQLSSPCPLPWVPSFRLLPTPFLARLCSPLACGCVCHRALVLRSCLQGIASCLWSGPCSARTFAHTVPFLGMAPALLCVLQYPPFFRDQGTYHPSHLVLSDPPNPM